MTSLPINLPDGFSPIVKVNDKVKVGDILAGQVNQAEEIINIPKELDINLKDVKNYLKKNPGDRVKVGDIIASKKNLFGNGVGLRSTMEGTVLRYERDSGNLVIKKQQKTTTKTLISPVDGTVSICDNNKIVIDTEKNVLVGLVGSGDMGEGIVTVLKKDDPYYIDSSTVGEIVVGVSITREMLLKGIGIGVMGIVGEEINDKDIDYLIEKKHKTPVIKVDKKNLEKIIEWNGKKVFLNPELKSIILTYESI